MAKAATQLQRGGCACEHPACCPFDDDVAAWRQDEDVDWGLELLSGCGVLRPMTEHCDIAPHDGGATVRRRTGARPPRGVGSAVWRRCTVPVKLEGRCEAADPRRCRGGRPRLRLLLRRRPGHACARSSDARPARRSCHP
jgi:hypothetical protein